MIVFNNLKANLKNNLISGLVIVVPVVISILVLKWLIDFFDQLLHPLLMQFTSRYIPGLGLIISLLFIYFVGLFAKNYLGSKVIAMGEWILVRIPVAKTIYTAIKQIVHTFAGQEKETPQKVAMVEYPRKGIYSIGLYNGDIRVGSEGRLMGLVLIVTSINPASGFTLLVPKEDIQFTTLPVEDAMKLIISGGIVRPEEIDITKR